jgi:hypothetical protein
LALEPVNTLLRSAASYFAFDDHEVVNNWPIPEQSNLAQADGDSSFLNGIVNAWDFYVAGGNPTLPFKRFFEFDYFGASFFMFSTREHRVTGESMLGSVQKQAFKDWLVAKNTSYVLIYFF